MISIDDFKKVEIRAGKILRVEMIEGSDKLLKLSVDFGSISAEGFRGTKQILSGIKKYFQDPQTLVGITCAFVTNVESRIMMGLESQGMIMAASSEKTEDGQEFFSILTMDCPPGSKVN